MILVDAGPLVALFDANDHQHDQCRRILYELDDELLTTTPVLGEAFHLLRPGSPGPPKLMEFIRHGGLGVRPLDDRGLGRCFELMVRYADLPMDFADASIVAAAEQTRSDKVFTLNGRDFATYRIRRGNQVIPFTIIGDAGGPGVERECVSVEESVGAP